MSVGLTMITSPAVLLCDEPTSGLDSWNQHAVVEGGWASGQEQMFVMHQHADPKPALRRFSCFRS